jgi:hypothetical protein
MDMLWQGVSVLVLVNQSLVHRLTSFWCRMSGKVKSSLNWSSKIGDLAGLFLRMCTRFHRVLFMYVHVSDSTAQIHVDFQGLDLLQREIDTFY